jgi:hypothetical protein
VQAAGQRRRSFEDFFVPVMANMAPSQLSFHTWLSYLQSQNPNTRLAALRVLNQHLDEFEKYDV